MQAYIDRARSLCPIVSSEGQHCGQELKKDGGCHLKRTTVESRFFEPPREMEIGSKNRDFEKSKVARNHA